MTTTRPDVASSALLDIAHAINHEHQRAGAAARTALHHARRCGELLIEARTRAEVRHGGWLGWLANNCIVSPRVAQLYMQLARAWADADPAKSELVSHLTIRDAIKFLTSDALPVERVTDRWLDLVAATRRQEPYASRLAVAVELEKQARHLRAEVDADIREQLGLTGECHEVSIVRESPAVGDLRFLMTTTMSSTLRADCELLLSRAPSMRAADFARELVALQDLWRIESNARERRPTDEQSRDMADTLDQELQPADLDTVDRQTDAVVNAEVTS